MAKKYLFLRGCLVIGKFDASGARVGGKELHTVSMDIKVEDTYAEHMNTCSAVAKRDARDLVERKVSATVEIDELADESLDLGLAGATTNTPTGTAFTAQSFPLGLVVNKPVPVPGNRMNLESLTMVDSTGSPVTLVAGTHYTVDLRAGLVTFLTFTGLTQPIKASGDIVDDYDTTTIGTESKAERWGRFSGVNLNNSNKAVIVDIPMMQIDPASVKIKESGNNYSSMSFECTFVEDSTYGFGSLLRANA